MAAIKNVSQEMKYMLVPGLRENPRQLLRIGKVVQRSPKQAWYDFLGGIETPTSVEHLLDAKLWRWGGAQSETVLCFLLYHSLFIFGLFI